MPYRDTDSEDDEGFERRPLVTNVDGSIQQQRGSLHHADGVNNNHSASSLSSSSPFHSAIPRCCCRLTPFHSGLLILFSLGLALLFPGILMRLESLPTPSPAILFNLCRQPSSFAAPTLERFRKDIHQKAEVVAKRTGLNAKDVRRVDGVDIETAALSVYVGSESYRCAEESAYEGSRQVIPLPGTLLYTGIQYVVFLHMPTYVVGGSVQLTLYSSEDVLFNVSTSLHLHRYSMLHDSRWLESTHPERSAMKVYNPSLAPALPHSRGGSRRSTSTGTMHDVDCRYKVGCSYTLREDMTALILTSTAFEVPTPQRNKEEAIRREEEQRQVEERAAAEKEENEHRDGSSGSSSRSSSSDNDVAPRLSEPTTRLWQQDESMLIHARNLTLVIESAQVIESDLLAQEAEAHRVPVESGAEYDYSDGLRSIQEGQRAGPTKFIAPDLIISFHQYQLSPMQQVGVGYIMKGVVMLLVALAIAVVKWSNDAQREKSKKR